MERNVRPCQFYTEITTFYYEALEANYQVLTISDQVLQKGVKVAEQV